MASTDYANDSAKTYSEIVADRSTSRLSKYFFSDGRSGYAKRNAVQECQATAWEEGLSFLIQKSKDKDCYLDERLLKEIKEAIAQIKIIKEAVAFIASETRDAEQMHSLLVRTETTVFTQFIILDKCIEAGWAEPLDLLIERTKRTYSTLENMPKEYTYYSVYKKANAGLKTIAQRRRAMDEKGKVAEVIKQNPALANLPGKAQQAQKNGN